MSALIDQPRAVRDGEQLDVARLSEYLSDHLPDRTEGLSVEQFPHGYSNLTYLLKWGGQEWVLRRPPFGSQVKTAHDMGASIAFCRGCATSIRRPRARSCSATMFRCWEHRFI